MENEETLLVCPYGGLSLFFEESLCVNIYLENLCVSGT